MQVFDLTQLARQRRRSAPDFAGYGFLKHALSAELRERLAFVPRTFKRALDLGAHDGSAGLDLPVDGVLHYDIITDHALAAPDGRKSSAPSLRVAGSLEVLPFADSTFDLVVSAGALQWVNDLPGTLVQLCHVLKPDSLFLAAIPGGRTLFELRQCFVDAEAELSGGIHQRFSPMLDMQQAGALLQRAGFAMPVADSDVLTVEYDHPLALLQDLRGMGETNAVLSRARKPLRRAVLQRAMQLYQDRFATAQGKVTATFEIIYLSGWSPGPDQPKPLRPGSAKTRLADALGVLEKSAGEKAG